MIIETIYKAVNGVKFYDKEECERYEIGLTKQYQTVRENTYFYDKDFKALPFPTIEEFYNGSEYKYLDDIEMISTKTNLFMEINLFFDSAGYCTKIVNQPSAIDLYVYDEGDCDYFPIDNKAIEALTLVKRLESLGLTRGLEQIIAERENIECTDEDTEE